MRYFFLTVILLAVTVVGIAGFRGDKTTSRPLELIPDMDQQAKIKAQASSGFFADGQGARQPIPGTVPVGLAIPGGRASEGFVDKENPEFSAGHGGDYYHTGKVENGTVWGDGFPKEVEINEAFIRLGQKQYNIHCFICHGKSGNGKGALALRTDSPNAAYGIANIANFLDPMYNDTNNAGYRPAGVAFDMISNGRGLMGRYGDKLNLQERWAIIAYIRSLALSKSAPLSDPTVKQAWDAASAPAK